MPVDPNSGLWHPEDVISLIVNETDDPIFALSALASGQLLPHHLWVTTAESIGATLLPGKISPWEANARVVMDYSQVTTGRWEDYVCSPEYGMLAHVLRNAILKALFASLYEGNRRRLRLEYPHGVTPILQEATIAGFLSSSIRRRELEKYTARWYEDQPPESIARNILQQHPDVVYLQHTHQFPVKKVILALSDLAPRRLTVVVHSNSKEGGIDFNLLEQVGKTLEVVQFWRGQMGAAVHCENLEVTTHIRKELAKLFSPDRLLAHARALYGVRTADYQATLPKHKQHALTIARESPFARYAVFNSTGSRLALNLMLMFEEYQHEQTRHSRSRYEIDQLLQLERCYRLLPLLAGVRASRWSDTRGLIGLAVSTYAEPGDLKEALIRISHLFVDEGWILGDTRHPPALRNRIASAGQMFSKLPSPYSYVATVPPHRHAMLPRSQEVLGVPHVRLGPHGWILGYDIEALSRGKDPLDSGHSWVELNTNTLDYMLAQEILATLGHSSTRRSGHVYPVHEDALRSAFGSLRPDKYEVSDIEDSDTCLIVKSSANDVFVEHTARKAGYTAVATIIAKPGENWIDRVIDALDKMSSTPRFVYLRDPLVAKDTPIDSIDLTRLSQALTARAEQLGGNEPVLIIDTSFGAFCTPDGVALSIDELLPLNSRRILVHSLSVETTSPHEEHPPIEVSALTASHRSLMPIAPPSGHSRHKTLALCHALRGSRRLGVRHEIELVDAVTEQLRSSFTGGPLSEAIRNESLQMLGTPPSPATSAGKQKQTVHVVGGGPAGLAIAFLLTLDGYQVVVHDNSLVQDPSTGKTRIVNAATASAGQVTRFSEHQTPTRTDKITDRRIAIGARVFEALAGIPGLGVYARTYVEYYGPNDTLWTVQARQHMKVRSLGSVSPFKLSEPDMVTGSYTKEQEYTQALTYESYAVDTEIFLAAMRTELDRLGCVFVNEEVTPQQVRQGFGDSPHPTVVAVGPNASDFWGIDRDALVSSEITEGYSVRFHYVGELTDQMVSLPAGPYIMQRLGGEGTPEDPHVLVLGGTTVLPRNMQRTSQGNIASPQLTQDDKKRIAEHFIEVAQRLTSQSPPGFDCYPTNCFTRENVVDVRAGYRSELPREATIGRDTRPGYEHIVHVGGLNHTGVGAAFGTAFEALQSIRSMVRDQFTLSA